MTGVNTTLSIIVRSCRLKEKKLGKYTEDVNKLINETDIMVINELCSLQLKEHIFLRNFEPFIKIKHTLKPPQIL